MILNGKPINPGELRTWVGLGRRTVSTETGGFQQGTYQLVTEVWAKVAYAHGTETWAAQAAGVQRAATVTIRYRPDINATWGVRIEGQWWDVVSPDDIQNRHEYIELKLKLTEVA